MNGLRTFVSAICLVVGAVLGAAWLAAITIASSIDEGDAVTQATAALVDDPAVIDAVAAEGTARVVDALRGLGVDLPGLEVIVAEIVGAVVHSEAFASAARAQAEAVGEQVLDGITSQSGPIVVTVDISDAVNAQLEQIPLVGPSLPELTIAPIPVQVATAEDADLVRSGWDRIQWAAAWAGWSALATLAVGFVVSHRKRWYLAKAALALAAVCALGWGFVKFGGPGDVVAAIPGMVANTVPAQVASALAEHASASVEAILGFTAIGAMIVAGLLFAFARATRGTGS